MKSLVNVRHGGPEVLEVRESAEPELKRGEVRVRVHAAGLNFSDVMARQGMYPDAPPPPMVMGYEASGVVEAVAPDVTTFKTGDRVIALRQFGAQAEQICVPAKQVAPMPANMSFEQGAALPVVYITAFHMLFRVASLRPGQRVLIHMAAGGVGTAAIQLCRTVPDVTILGTASAGKHDQLRAMGCDHPIDYRDRDYVEEVLRLTDGKGVDLVLDPLGGKDWKKGMNLLRPAGMLIAFGFANMASGERRSFWHMLKQGLRIPIFTPLSLMDANRAVAGVNVGHLWQEIDMLKEELDALLALFQQGKIDPQIDASFPFSKAGDAHRRLSERKNVGKVVLTPG